MMSGYFLLHVVEKIYRRVQEPYAVAKAFQIVANMIPGLFPNITDTLCDEDQCPDKQTICDKAGCQGLSLPYSGLWRWQNWLKELVSLMALDDE